MFARDPWTTSVVHVTGPYNTLGQTQDTVTQDQSDIRTLHSLALSIYQLRQEGNAALQRGDLTRVRQAAESVRTMAAYFRQVSTRFVARSQEDFSAFERFLLATGEWVQKALAALPSALAALPKAAVDAVTDLTDHMLDKLGGTVRKGLWNLAGPALVLGVALIGVVALAEKTRTGRAASRALA